MVEDDEKANKAIVYKCQELNGALQGGIVAFEIGNLAYDHNLQIST